MLKLQHSFIIIRVGVVIVILVVVVVSVVVAIALVVTVFIVIMVVIDAVVMAVMVEVVVMVIVVEHVVIVAVVSVIAEVVVAALTNIMSSTLPYQKCSRSCRHISHGNLLKVLARKLLSCFSSYEDCFWVRISTYLLTMTTL